MIGLPALTTELTETSTKRWAKLNRRCPEPGTSARSASQNQSAGRTGPRRSPQRKATGVIATAATSMTPKV
jgi:hypothetical protein